MKLVIIVKEESDVGEFVKVINVFIVNGGGDCLEYIFIGMLEVIY